MPEDPFWLLPSAHRIAPPRRGSAQASGTTSKNRRHPANMSIHDAEIDFTSTPRRGGRGASLEHAE
jgi:hypothetical protein